MLKELLQKLFVHDSYIEYYITNGTIPLLMYFIVVKVKYVYFVNFTIDFFSELS